MGPTKPVEGDGARFASWRRIAWPFVAMVVAGALGGALAAAPLSSAQGEENATGIPPAGSGAPAGGSAAPNAAAAPAPAPPPSAERAPAPAPVGSTDSDEDAIVLNFEAADIREVVHSLAGALGISYLIDPRVEGQVTIRTTGKIPRRDLFPIFNQILRSIGIAAVKVGEVYNIMPIAEAKTRVNVSRNQLPGMISDDLFVIELVAIRNLAAQEMVNLIQPFITPGGDVFAYPRANFVIITDIASNVDRLREMIQLLDRDSFKDLKARIFKIKNADIEDLGQELLSVLDTYGITGEAANERGVYAIPLVRLNSVAVLAFNEDSFRAVEYWLKLLDVPPDETSSRTVRVYNVQNAKAADLAQVLNELYGGSGGGTSGAGGPLPGQPGATGGRGGFGGLGGGGTGGFGGSRSGGLGGGGSSSRGGLGSGGLGGASSISGSSSGSRGLGGASSSGLGGGGGGGGLGGGSSGSSGGLGSRGGRSAQPAGVLGGAGGAGGTGASASGFIIPGGQGPLSIFQNEVRIVADEISNSLVILATKRDYTQILQVLKDLDVVPRQVVIEVLIAEISLNKDMQMGLKSVIAAPGGSINPLPTASPAPTPTPTTSGGTMGALLDSVAQNLPAGLSSAAKRFIDTSGTGITAFITDQSHFQFELTALASAGRLKVLASPNLLTADNREASIHIGTEIPILTSQATLAGVQQNGTNALVNNVQYRSTGVILRILPQINADGLVNLQVRQEVSDVDSNFSSSTGSPAFTTREAETTAVVQNGDSLLIGGIIQETTSRGRSGVPYLMDLPVLGRLFRADTDMVRRVELIILLTPKVIRNRGESLSVTQEYKDRLWDVVDEIETTKGMKMPSQQEIYQRKRLRMRATTAEKPRAGVLPNRDPED